MKTRSLVCAGIMACCVAGSAAAQQYALDVGVAPTMARMSPSVTIRNNDIALNDLGIDNKATLTEGYAALHTRAASIRGYYLFPKSLSADGLLPTIIATDKDKNPIPITTTLTLKANRLEVAVPLRVSRFVLVEPMFVYQTISPAVSITGKGYSFNSSPKLSAAGIGVELTERLTLNSTLRVKYLATDRSSLFEAEARYYDANMFIGGGYSCWNYDIGGMKMRAQGPMLRAGFRF